MARTEPVILTNMCMICDGDNVLVQDRRNPDWPGVTFPGGHVEPCESFVRSIIREVKEETGYTLTRFAFRGIVTFVSDIYETEYMHLFTADGYEGTLTDCDEGELAWIPKSELFSLNLWEGDKIFLDLLIKDTPLFSLTLKYKGAALVESKVIKY